MKRLLVLFALFFLAYSNANAQNMSLGGGLNLTLPSKNLSFGVGLNLLGEYRFHKNYAVRLNSSFTLSMFGSIKYFGDDTYVLGSIESDFLCYPIEGSSKLYGGVGFGYYIPGTTIGGMPHYIKQNVFIAGNFLENTISPNFLAGIKFRADKPFSINLELKYVYLRPRWTQNVSGDINAYGIKLDDKIDLSALTTNLSFIFRL